MWALRLLLAAAMAPGFATAVEPVGFAVSDEPFLVEGGESPGNATVLAGEAVSSNHLPLRVRLSAGPEIALGPGSQARFWSDRMRLEGVSAEFQAGPRADLTLELGPLRFQATAGGGCVIYSDRPELASAWAMDGPLLVSAGEGESVTLEAGSAATFMVTGGELQVQPERAPLEIARIQIRQLAHLGRIAVSRPGVRGRLQPLLQLLSDASGGLLRGSPAGQRLTPAALSAVDAPLLLEAALQVHRALLDEPWAEAGCGSPDCIRRGRVRQPVDFAGWTGGTPPPQPGCQLCRRAGPDAATGSEATESEEPK